MEVWSKGDTPSRRSYAHADCYSYARIAWFEPKLKTNDTSVKIDRRGPMCHSQGAAKRVPWATWRKHRKHAAVVYRSSVHSRSVSWNAAHPLGSDVRQSNHASAWSEERKRVACRRHQAIRRDHVCRDISVLRCFLFQARRTPVGNTNKMSCAWCGGISVRVGVSRTSLSGKTARGRKTGSYLPKESRKDEVTQRVKKCISWPGGKWTHQYDKT